MGVRAFSQQLPAKTHWSSPRRALACGQTSLGSSVTFTFVAQPESPWWRPCRPCSSREGATVACLFSAVWKLPFGPLQPLGHLHVTDPSLCIHQYRRPRGQPREGFMELGFGPRARVWLDIFSQLINKQSWANGSPQQESRNTGLWTGRERLTGHRPMRI